MDYNSLLINANIFIKTINIYRAVIEGTERDTVWGVDLELQRYLPGGGPSVQYVV